MNAVVTPVDAVVIGANPLIAALCAESNLSKTVTTVDFKLSTKVLKNIYSATTTDVIPFIEKHMLTYDINSRVRMAAFLSACFIMSSGFRRKAESYDFTACRLFKESPKVDSYKLATRLVRNGEREIANYLFCFENGNGGIDSDDGWMYRARTPLQFRGRTFYQTVNDVTGIDCINHPELLEDPENSIIAAMAHWQAEGYNEMTDQLKFANTFELQVKPRKNSSTKDYHSNRMAVKMKKKISGKTTGIIDFCEFIESGMLYL